MKPHDIIDYLCQRFTGLLPKASWGETSLFYNPDQRLPNGIYFCTIKQHNGDHDQASHLDRDGVFRLSFGMDGASYQQLFGMKPKRAAKGQVVGTGHDFAALNQLMPHPIYAWMGWVQILNPTESMMEELLPWITQSYNLAVRKYAKRLSARDD